MQNSTRIWLLKSGMVLGFALCVCAVAIAVIRQSVTDPEVVIAPPCDTRANASTAAEQLRARIVAGVVLTECDIEQFDHLAGLVEDWETDVDRCTDLEHAMMECEWGWWDTSDCRRYQEASRLEAAMTALYKCADASVDPS